MQINMPSCYIQEKNAISNIAKHLEWLKNEKVLIIMDEFTYNNLKEEIIKGLNRDNIEYCMEQFIGQCSRENIDKLIEKASKTDSRTIIGIGGGKTLDVAKAVAHYNKMKSVIIPTSASTDGACSKLSVLYNNKGEFEEYIVLDRNPEAIIVDLEVIVNAPVRLFKAGIGDAISTYFETEAGYEGQLENGSKERMSLTARIISKECFNIIMTHGCEAIKAVEEKQITDNFEQIVEAIIYLSCIGFENGSLAAAHAVANALTDGEYNNELLHGEKVAFGTIVQILLQKKCGKNLIEVINFFKKLGLPTNINQVGLAIEDVEGFIEKLCKEGQPIYNMKKEYCNFDNISAAIRYTNNL